MELTVSQKRLPEGATILPGMVVLTLGCPLPNKPFFSQYDGLVEYEVSAYYDPATVYTTETPMDYYLRINFFPFQFAEGYVGAVSRFLTQEVYDLVKGDPADVGAAMADRTLDITDEAVLHIRGIVECAQQGVYSAV